jgi:hypothetical protein
MADNTINPNFSPNPNSTVLSLYLDGSTLYAGGWFSQIGGQARQYLASVNTTNGNATSWNPFPNSIVNSITKSGTTVYVGGSFTVIAGKSQSYLAMLDANTGALISPLGVNSTVQTIRQDNDNIYVGGSFSGAQGLQARYGTKLTSSNDTPGLDFPVFNSTVNISIPDGAGGWYVGGSFSGLAGKNYLVAYFAG